MPKPPNDDYWAGAEDDFQDAKTALEIQPLGLSADATAVADLGPEPITAPHDLRKLASSVEAEVSAAREDACRSCYSEGQRDAVSAFMLVFLQNGLSSEEIKNILLTVEGKLTRL